MHDPARALHRGIRRRSCPFAEATGSPPTTGKLASSKCRRETVARCFLRPSPPALAFRNGRDKELEVAEQWDLISLGSTTYLSSPLHFHADDTVDDDDDDDGIATTPTSSVLLCARRDGLPTGVQLSSLKNSPRQTVSPFFSHLPLSSRSVYGINVLAHAAARDVINPRRVSRWRWE